MIDRESAIKSTSCSNVNRGADYRNAEKKGGWKKFLALAIVGIMIISSMALIAPSIEMDNGDSEEEITASIENGGSREETIKISHFFDSFLKPTDYSQLGRHNGTSGLNSWFALRTAYQEYTLRDNYPYLVVYYPYSEKVVPEVSAGYQITSTYRMAVTTKNVTECNTTYYDSNLRGDPGYLPLRGDPTINGSWVNMSLYMTYLTTQEMNDIYRVGNHYANFYYGVPIRRTPAPSMDDGYWHEVQGYFDINRPAAQKYFNLNGTGDLRDEWNWTTMDSMFSNDIELDWRSEWTLEGSAGGKYDIYTAYDYPNDIRAHRSILDWANSTSDMLRVRLWSVSWGNDCYLPRLLEAQNIIPNWQAWSEDWYLNATIGPDMADFEQRYTTWYHPSASKDPNVFMGSWAFEAEHLDWTANNPIHTSYPSPFNDYDPVAHPEMKRTSYSPGTMEYGNATSYFVAPLIMNLSDGDKMIIELPTNDVIGYTPYRGIGDNISTPWKRNEIADRAYWGELVLGACNPSMNANYDAATKTITLEGPIDFYASRIPNAVNTSNLAEGCPSFSFAVSTVSSYTETIEAGQKETGVPYTVTVTAKNLSDATAIGWNGTVHLSCSDPGASFPGGDSHTFVPASDNGVWTTTVQFSRGGDFYINATDEWFAADVTGSIQVAVVDVIPPTAVAGDDLEVDIDTLVNFNGSGSSDNVGIVNYTWTFVDVTAQTLYGVNTSYTFANAGIFSVTLNVTDEAGLYDTDIVNITVLEEPAAGPTADAGPDQTVDVDTTVTFDGSDSTGADNYTWTFTYDGETQTLYGVAPTFAFEIAGTYDVTLTVKDTANITDTDTVVIDVSEEEEDAETSFLSDYWWVLVLIIVIIAIIVAVFMMRGRGGKPSSIPEAEEKETVD